VDLGTSTAGEVEQFVLDDEGDPHVVIRRGATVFYLRRGASGFEEREIDGPTGVDGLVAKDGIVLIQDDRSLFVDRGGGFSEHGGPGSGNGVHASAVHEELLMLVNTDPDVGFTLWRECRR